MDCSPRRRVLFLSQLTFILSALAIVATTAAHENVDPSWCIEDGYEPVIVKKYDFDEEELRALFMRCGIVDDDHHDDWQQVSSAVGYYCHVEVEQRLGIPEPFVSGPGQFLSKDHHDAYRVSQGLTGVCAICIKKP